MQECCYITPEDLVGFKLSPNVRIYAGRGWLPLVLSAKSVIEDATVAAVREDAGALRIELNHYSPRQREWLAEVEAASRMVCEICGEPGQLRFEGFLNGRPAGWHRTRCDEHIDTRTSKDLKGMVRKPLHSVGVDDMNAALIKTAVDVICDICSENTRVEGGCQYGTLQARWGYGSNHHGEHYQVNLCEGCFFQALATLRQERRIHTLFDNTESAASEDESFGLVGRDEHSVGG